MRELLYLVWFTFTWCAVCVCGFDATAKEPRIDDWFRILTIINFIIIVYFAKREDSKNGY
ncbi:hypothetical protein D307_gp079 [Bacillus phage Bastille]|uniref:Uncharacterized protein n=4 Tax=Bastillevirus TaxID=1918010 RepID=J9PLT2_9CAUD|nr:hypothetical protein D307_gp079 [Bacillus phage Bastille]YP_009035437.1 hypothetical protein FP73_gp101 [Bacillus phage Hoody T]YP_009037153.1 hypothetical protein FP74_gp109 [Bacillus phage CAM003]ASU01105.1 hypothetical protein ANTHONY_265 [Bacillus phage Anthony]AEQ34385.1 hypothetical protein [Bacillus phage Bastille]AHZ09687.1 hypothetical protein [Bacillus phage CAM003]AHZ10552.1 hypothetical protein [Bacillus phage Hoody T]